MYQMFYLFLLLNVLFTHRSCYCFGSNFLLLFCNFRIFHHTVIRVILKETAYKKLTSQIVIALRNSDPGNILLEKLFILTREIFKMFLFLRVFLYHFDVRGS